MRNLTTAIASILLLLLVAHPLLHGAELHHQDSSDSQVTVECSICGGTIAPDSSPILVAQVSYQGSRILSEAEAVYQIAIRVACQRGPPTLA